MLKLKISQKSPSHCRHIKNKRKKNEKGRRIRKKTWGEEEHKKLIEGILLFGKDWLKVSEHVGIHSRAFIVAKGYNLKNKLKNDTV